MRITRAKLARLEKLALLRAAAPTVDAAASVQEAWQTESWQRIAAHPSGPDVVLELWEIMNREATTLPPGYHQCELRQRLLRDERARELACRLAEIGGELD